MATIAHIINPYKTPKGTEADRTQQLVFESMLLAKANSEQKNSIQLCSTQFADDAEYIPDGAEKFRSICFRF
jgi:hypothetical protein